MGDIWGDGGENEKPVHLVIVPAFQLAKYPVTQSQWLKVMGGENPAVSSGEKFVHPEKPVINVSWDDAREFISRLNRKSGCSYRLPSEAEWEYAARSCGGRDKYSGTSSESSLSAYGWYIKNSDYRVHVVGWKRSNDLGLYDMSGNVWELCEDSCHDNYKGAPCDGSAWVPLPGSAVAAHGSPRGSVLPRTVGLPDANVSPRAIAALTLASAFPWAIRLAGN